MRGAASWAGLRGVARHCDRQLGGRLGRLWRGWRQRGLPARPDRAVPLVRLGSDYGGWWVVPDALAPGDVVYSFGVGEDVTFDEALIERFGVEVHAFDPTPRSIDWVLARALPQTFHFHPVGVAARDGTARFRPPENDAWVSHTILDRPATDDRAIDVPVRRASTLARERGHDRLALVKLDVEGAEYEVLDDLLEAGPPVRQILVEFHHRFLEGGLARTRRAIARLRAAGYDLVAVSESREEFSFLRRRPVAGRSPRAGPACDNGLPDTPPGSGPATTGR